MTLENKDFFFLPTWETTTLSVYGRGTRATAWLLNKVILERWGSWADKTPTEKSRTLKFRHHNSSEPHQVFYPRNRSVKRWKNILTLVRRFFWCLEKIIIWRHPRCCFWMLDLWKGTSVRKIKYFFEKFYRNHFTPTFSNRIKFKLFSSYFQSKYFLHFHKLLAWLSWITEFRHFNLYLITHF